MTGQPPSDSHTTNKPQRPPTSRRDQPLRDWFATLGWQASTFQREAWARYLAGESGLLHSPTGSGKTLAALGGVLIEALEQQKKNPSNLLPATRKKTAQRLKLVWITPLRALATDTLRAIQDTLIALDIDWTVALRTGDASARDKRLARSGKAEILVTTPESLALLLSYPDTAQQFGHLQAIVVDEWHELIGNKRGVLLQLGLARLRKLSPGVRCWGLSATIGNLDEARSVLLPHLPESTIVSAKIKRKVEVITLIPEENQRLPWAGHLGLARLPDIVKRLFATTTTLLFTNTRAQAELWFKALSAVWPESLDSLALHHGSLDTGLRQHAERGLRDGSLRCVVATSSLDLGVDFPAVDQVIQIGSPKGVARLLQRAGRARHRPGEEGTVICVPAQAMELLEYAAAREAIEQNRVEARPPLINCVDVLAQHCVTLALGGGFYADELLAEVRTTHAFAKLDDQLWTALLNFIVRGGEALSHYPDFHRVVMDDDGRYHVTSKRVALRHRLSIGTITSDGSITVKLLRGGTLGSVEESFISRLQPKESFHFAGRQLQLVQLDHMTALVRPSKEGKGAVVSWPGGRLPLSTQLGHAVARLLCADDDQSEERQALAPLLKLQQKVSTIPQVDELLIEQLKTRRGYHLAIYPFAGRTLHEGMAAVIAYRLASKAPTSFGYTVNDYGFMLTAATPFATDATVFATLFAPENLFDDLEASLNLTELARRHFREIARIAGLLVPSMPGRASRSMRQVQASSGLIFDVLQRYDADHLLLQQATREVLDNQLNVDQLESLLNECAQRKQRLHQPRWLTPLSFPLWAENLRGHLSTEDWLTRVRRAAEELEKRYDRQR